MMPAMGTPEYEAYNEWLHYFRGSAMVPLMLNLYVSRLKKPVRRYIRAPTARSPTISAMSMAR